MTTRQCLSHQIQVCLRGFYCRFSWSSHLPFRSLPSSPESQHSCQIFIPYFCQETPRIRGDGELLSPSCPRSLPRHNSLVFYPVRQSKSLSCGRRSRRNPSFHTRNILHVIQPCVFQPPMHPSSSPQMPEMSSWMPSSTRSFMVRHAPLFFQQEA